MTAILKVIESKLAIVSFFDVCFYVLCELIIAHKPSHECHTSPKSLDEYKAVFLGAEVTCQAPVRCEDIYVAAAVKGRRGKFGICGENEHLFETGAALEGIGIDCTLVNDVRPRE